MSLTTRNWHALPVISYVTNLRAVSDSAAKGYRILKPGLIISQTSCPDIFQEGGLVYMVTYTNFTGQVVKLVGQMPKLTGKCPVTDC